MVFTSVDSVIPIILTLTILYSRESLGQSYNETDSLLTALLTDYNKNIRPLNDQSQALSMQLTLQPGSITEFDFVKQTLTIPSIVKMFWRDEKITWAPASHGNINKVFMPRGEVWAPPIVLVNPAKDLELVGSDWMYIQYNSSGHATFEPGTMLEATCPLDVTNWPFDTQVCSLTFGALGYHTDRLQFTAVEIEYVYFHPNGEWEITATATATETLVQSSVATVTFNLKRRPTFLLVNLLLPIIFLMGLIVCVFLLPPTSGERVGYAITILLSISVLFGVVTDFIPSTSSPMANVTYYMMINFVISVLICFGTMFSLRLHLKPETAPAPKWCNKCIRLLLCRCRQNEVSSEKEGDVEQPRFKKGKLPAIGKCNKLKKHLEPDVHHTECAGKPVTWKELGDTVDKIQFVVFSLLIITFTLWFMIGMATTP